MKKYIVIMMMLGMMIPAIAQKGRDKSPRRANFEKVDAAQVPDAVKSAFNSANPGATAYWEKHMARGKSDRPFTKYVAVFVKDGNRARARYREDGTPLSSSKYMKGDKLPDAVKNGMKAKYPDFTPTGGEEVKGKEGKTFYRVRAKKGSAKVTTYFDENGNEISREKVGDDMKEGEDEGDENGN